LFLVFGCIVVFVLLFLYMFFSFLFLLVIRLYPLSLFLPVCILMSCGVSVFDSDFWIVDVNDILIFRSMRMSIGLGILYS
jgi:hypothetical protein